MQTDGKWWKASVTFRSLIDNKWNRNLECKGGDVANFAAAEVEDAEVRRGSEEAVGQRREFVRRQIQLGQHAQRSQERETRGRRVFQSTHPIQLHPKY